MSAVIDSNVLIYHLNGALTPVAERRVKAAIGAGGFISVITRIEILGWQGQTEDSLRIASSLLDLIGEKPLTETIVQLCIDLRQSHRIKLPDAIIAATALDLGLPLMTRNTTDFDEVENLELVNPFQAAT